MEKLEMNCMSCGGIAEQSNLDFFHYLDAGLSNVYLKSILIIHCLESGCGEEEIVIDNILDLHDMLAKRISAQVGKLSPEEIRFLRTHLGFSGADFAREVMCVSPESILHWEKGLAPMNDASERLLRVLILSRQAPFHVKELSGFGVQKNKSKDKQVFYSHHGKWTEV
jgi:putative transcriptional regulator